MKGKYHKLKLIEILKEAPFFTYAAKKVGVARSTLYRWYQNDKEFQQAVDSALTDGRGQLGDIAEMKLIELIKKGDLNAIKFFLLHNDKRYRPKLPTYIPPSKRNLKIGDTCDTCNQTKPAPIPDIPQEEMAEIVRQALKDWDELKAEHKKDGLDFDDMISKYKVSHNHTSNTPDKPKL